MEHLVQWIGSNGSAIKRARASVDERQGPRHADSAMRAIAPIDWRR
jgi:hypothetical protein